MGESGISLTIERKICNKCNELKSFKEFCKNKECKNGRCNLCKKCFNIYNNNRRRGNQEYLKDRREAYHNAQNTTWHKLHIRLKLIERTEKKPYHNRAKIMRRGICVAKNKGIPADLEYFTIDKITKMLMESPYCICCRRKLDVNSKFDKIKHDDSPTLDRFIPELGYIQRNVSILCWRCNNLKRDANINELRKIVDWMKVKSLT